MQGFASKHIKSIRYTQTNFSFKTFIFGVEVSFQKLSRKMAALEDLSYSVTTEDLLERQQLWTEETHLKASSHSLKVLEALGRKS